MERNRDWKPIAALVLAGLALFVALGGRWSINFSNEPGNQVAQAVPMPVAPQMQVQPAVPPGTDTDPGKVFPTMPQKPQMPQAPQVQVPDNPNFQFGPGYRGWGGPGYRGWGGPFRILPGLILAAGVILLGLFLLRRGRFGPRRPWGPGSWGPGGPGGPWGPQGPQGPQGRWGPPYQGGYQGGPPPPQGPQQAQWQGPPPPQGQWQGQGQTPDQGQGPLQNGDITRPENTQL